MFCRCCLRKEAFPGPIFVPDALPSRGAHGVQVCGLCSKHQGNLPVELRRRDSVHIEMWQTDMEEALEAARLRHGAQVEHLEERIAKLEQELSDRPVQVVDKYVDADVLQAAHDEADRAFRSRERVMRDMTALHLLHFETSSGQCRCGRPADSCDACKILEGSKALKAWERRQSDLRKRGEPHHLPQGHPGVVDARWDPDDPQLAELYDDWGEPIY